MYFDRIEFFLFIFDSLRVDKIPDFFQFWKEFNLFMEYISTFNKKMVSMNSFASENVGQLGPFKKKT